MHKKLVLAAPLLATVAAAATVAPRATVNVASPAPRVQIAQAAPAPYRPVPQPAVAPAPSGIDQAVSQWHALRQSDNLPFASYAWFLTRYSGWPGEASMRKSAERAADPAIVSPASLIAYFRVVPPKTATGHARHALALHASGQADAAREAARQAWRAGSLSPVDETQLLTSFGNAFGSEDYNWRLEALLASGDTAGASRIVPYASPARRPIFEARLAMQTRAPDAAAKLAALGPIADSDANVLMDRANWLRDTGQSLAARNLLARPRTLTVRPVHPEKWFETLLAMARAAAGDKQWTLAYQIASQVDDAYPAGTEMIRQPEGERDDYTSLTWLAGTTALHRLNRPADAAAMFQRYARGGRSTQVLTKGLYWAGRAAETAGQSAQAGVYFAEAAKHPELFYGQLSLERIGSAVPAPVFRTTAVQPTPNERAAFQSKHLVQATRLLGHLGRWDDQSLFVRALSEQAETESERVLTAEFSRQISRADLSVWIARNARNAGSPFYAREAYPEVRIPATQRAYWSLAHGIIRQESSFDRGAVSHAGARGMMQLMPGTARQTASKLSVAYELGRLTRDPDYNVMLGCHYFAKLMDQWGGYAPLAVASYNAGPGNVRKWIERNGDPRTPGVDIVRWIEEIPFAETRGYVQRVLENAVVYDAINPAQARASSATRLSYYLGKTSRPG